MHACDKREWSCCQGRIWNTPRHYSTTYKPFLQVKGHNCKRWYIGALAVVNSITGMGGTLFNNLKIRNCLTDDCNAPEMCDQKRCGASGSCKWDPKANAKPDWGKKRVATFCAKK